MNGYIKSLYAQLREKEGQEEASIERMCKSLLGRKIDVKRTNERKLVRL